MNREARQRAIDNHRLVHQAITAAIVDDHDLCAELVNEAGRDRMALTAAVVTCSSLVARIAAVTDQTPADAWQLILRSWEEGIGP